MKRAYLYAMLLSIPVLLLVVAWQAGRYDALASEARRLESSQEAWVQENRKLEAGIRVLSSRERADALARGLGLKEASPGDRLRVIVKPAQGEPGATDTARARHE
jgi:hypothetical protein